MGFDTDHSSGDLGLRPSLISPLVSTLSPPSLQPPPSSQSQQQPQQQQEELKLSKEVETKMKRWVKGFCEVVFNLDEGPVSLVFSLSLSRFGGLWLGVGMD